MTPEQCRGARGMLDMTQEKLATAARVGLSTVKNFEAGRSVPVTNNLDAMVRALEAAGIRFIDDEDGAGMRLLKSPPRSRPRPRAPRK